MYAIGYIVFGIPLNEEIEKELDKLGYDPDSFFETVYHGSAPSTQGWCGVHLCRFNECDDFKVSSLKLVPTEEQKKDALARIEELPEEV